MHKAILLDDTIEVTALNREGKFFQSVTRVDALSKMYDIKLQVDINTDIYPVEQDSHYSFCIAKTLSLDGTEDKGFYTPDMTEGSLADKYDYVMHGKIFRSDSEKPGEMYTF
eukprot:TRINITY_DN7926_c0_g3_i2.p1 TRINITY_DN7926_c0_g3~~TRINITY_DN7926_c0_g3_i2.p1  ORF type:complete len:112 (-),score=38.95 TRINITY_DN7926_c0_g3_i2:249-584(-)